MAGCCLKDFDELLGRLLLPTGAVPPSDEQLYRIDRLRMNFRLDFDDLRKDIKPKLKGWLKQRGPNVQGLRQILLRVAVQQSFSVTGTPNSTSELWSWLANL